MASADKSIRPNRIKDLRLRSRLTQSELAQLVGLSLSTVCKHEAKHRGLTDDAIARYAQVFKVKTYEIFVDRAELEGDIETETEVKNESPSTDGFKGGFKSYASLGVAS